MRTTTTQNMGLLRKIIGRAMATTSSAFVVPDVRTARSAGLDIKGAGLRTADNPRHASVLVIVGPLPERLRQAALVAFSQIPQPRAIIALGSDIHLLAGSAITGPATQEGLLRATHQLRSHIQADPWADTGSFVVTDEMLGPEDAPEARVEHVHHGDTGDGDHVGIDGAHHKHEMQQDEHHMGQGDHSASRMDQSHHQADHGDHGSHQMNCGDHSGHDMEQSEAGTDHAQHQMDHGGQEMDHGGHDMDGGGFMSMMMMTKDLPRSDDGLPMEWVETAFGPLFPSLPGGLAPTMTLDGDVVASITFDADILHRSLASFLVGPLTTFPDRLTNVDPGAPVFWRALAIRACLGLMGHTMPEQDARGWVGACERDRAASHAGWLAQFAGLLGLPHLVERAAKVQLDLVRGRDMDAIAPIRAEVQQLTEDVRRTPMLGRRLRGIGPLDRRAARNTSGVVARASGVAADARMNDRTYQALCFEPIVKTGEDALSRLNVRLEEMSQSLDLVLAAGTMHTTAPRLPDDLTGSAEASIETPHGSVILHITAQGDRIESVIACTGSVANLVALPPLVQGMELADALVTIASFDISPWETSA